MPFQSYLYQLLPPFPPSNDADHAECSSQQPGKPVFLMRHPCMCRPVCMPSEQRDRVYHDAASRQQTPPVARPPGGIGTAAHLAAARRSRSACRASSSCAMRC
eukprot:365811-Chlamydomonas_euryale.AAC.21